MKPNPWRTAAIILAILFVVTWFEANDACDLINYCV